MSKWRTWLFSSPVFADEEKTRRAQLLNVILHIVLGFTLTAAGVFTILDAASFWGNPNNLVIIGVMLIAPLFLRIFMQRGHIQVAGILMSLALLAITTFSLWNFGGIGNATTSSYLLCIIVAGLLVGGRGATSFTGLVVLMILGVWYSQQNGLVRPLERAAPMFELIAYSGTFIMSGVLLRYAVNNAAESLHRARRNEQAQLEANRELRALRDSLEHQIADRTRDLQRRSAYLEAAAQVGRAASSTLDMSQLVEQVVQLIHARFNLYHVALFLLDASGQWAEFRAGTGQVGRVLQEEKFRLPVGGQSMVGGCIARGQARVAQDVSAAGDYVSHPLLADTRAEAALPLIARGRVIGALSAQSAQTGAFEPDVVAVLQTMADQVAAALDNARLFAESQAALEAERRATGAASREAWNQLLRTGQVAGYRFTGSQIVPADETESAWPLEAHAALQAGKSIIITGRAAPTLALPVRVRGQTIGVVDMRKDTDYKDWTPQEIALAENMAEQLGVALESARLYQDTQRRAAREQLVGQVTTRIRETLDLETMLKTATHEVRQSLNLPEVVIRLTAQPEQPREHIG
jgi:GAF domain-containing protein